MFDGVDFVVVCVFVDVFDDVGYLIELLCDIFIWFGVLLVDVEVILGVV